MNFDASFSDKYEVNSVFYSFEQPQSSFNVSGPMTSFQQSFDFDRTESYNFSDDIPDSDLRPLNLPSVEGPLLPSATDIPAAEEAASGALFSTDALALPATYATHAVLDSYSQQQYLSDMQGGSIVGHSYLAPLQAQSNLNVHSTQNSLAATAVGVGAMFGPEGLVAGLAAGALISSVDMTSPVNVTTDTGEQIPADQLISQ